MISRDEYIVRMLESLQDELEVMDYDEIYDTIEHILDIMVGVLNTVDEEDMV